MSLAPLEASGLPPVSASNPACESMRETAHKEFETEKKTARVYALAAFLLGATMVYYRVFPFTTEWLKLKEGISPIVVPAIRVFETVMKLFYGLMWLGTLAFAAKPNELYDRFNFDFSSDDLKSKITEELKSRVNLLFNGNDRHWIRHGNFSVGRRGVEKAKLIKFKITTEEKWAKLVETANALPRLNLLHDSYVQNLPLSTRDTTTLLQAKSNYFKAVENLFT